MKFDEVEARLQGPPMIYKGIEWLCGDPNPLRKKVEGYKSAISTFLSLEKAASTYRSIDDVVKEKALCVKQVNFARSHLPTVRADLDASTEKLKGVE